MGSISLPLALSKAEYFQPNFSVICWVMFAYKTEDVVYSPKGGNSEKEMPLLGFKDFAV